jgi:hypothetical protein
MVGAFVVLFQEAKARTKGVGARVVVPIRISYPLAKSNSKDRSRSFALLRMTTFVLTSK